LSTYAGARAAALPTGHQDGRAEISTAFLYLTRSSIDDWEGNYAAAEANARRGLEAVEARVGPNNQYLAEALNLVGLAVAARGR
jgi:hypothetical protein